MAVGECSADTECRERQHPDSAVACNTGGDATRLHNTGDDLGDDLDDDQSAAVAAPQQPGHVHSLVMAEARDNTVLASAVVHSTKAPAFVQHCLAADATVQFAVAAVQFASVVVAAAAAAFVRA